jgi:hypothetical protein
MTLREEGQSWLGLITRKLTTHSRIDPGIYETPKDRSENATSSTGINEALVFHANFHKFQWGSPSKNPH